MKINPVQGYDGILRIKQLKQLEPKVEELSEAIINTKGIEVITPAVPSGAYIDMFSGKKFEIPHDYQSVVDAYHNAIGR